MSLELLNFDEMSRQIAKDFLRSVLVVDDHPVFEEEEVVGKLQPPDVVVEAVQSPAPEGETKTSSTEGVLPSAAAVGPSPEPVVPPVEAGDPHTLPFNRFSDSFAALGMFCTVLTPEKDHLDDFVSQSVGESGLANRADVVILDWVLHGFKEGEKTLDIIGRLAQSEGGAKPRKRLLLVYTGESDLLGIATKIRNRLKVPAIAGASAREQTHITSGATRIAIYAKPHVKVIQDLQPLVVSAEAIPQIVISEFANASPGLLSNLILRSMGVLRSETYQILKKFPPKLDAAFVTHKILENPEDAGPHLLPLLVSEIQTALEDNGVIEVLLEPALNSWLDRLVQGGHQFSLQNVTEAEALAGIRELLKKPATEVGADEVTHTRFAVQFLRGKNNAAKQVTERLTQVLSGTADHLANQEFAILMSTRSRYGTPPPRLALGTIIRDRVRNKYLLCVQPRCDSVRLTAERQFPFLPLTVAEAGYGFVAPYEGGIITLKLSDEPYLIEMLPFLPWTTAESEVLGKGQNDMLFFKSPTTEDNFQWVSELRTDHAQRIANALAAKISRVALNESQWLRWYSKKN
jgi:hypothetical protein